MQHVGYDGSCCLMPPAAVADVGQPRPVPARSGQLSAHPSFDSVLTEDGPVVLAAVGVEPSQIPDAGAAAEPHVLLERQVGVQLGSERAGEAPAAHDRAAAGTGSTQ